MNARAVYEKNPAPELHPDHVDEPPLQADNQPNGQHFDPTLPKLQPFMPGNGDEVNGERHVPGVGPAPPGLDGPLPGVGDDDEARVIDVVRNREQQLAGAEGHIAATTLSVKQALDQHGREALISLFDETGQMVTKKVFHPVTWDMLPSDQRKRVLRSLMFVKRKRNGKLKSRFCVDGRPQKVYGNGDHSSPTAATTSIFLSATIDAYEKRHVKVVDIEGAYLKVNMTEDVYVTIDETLSAILANMMPAWAPLLARDRRLLVKLDKALYGCVQSAKLFYNSVAMTLKGMGFVPNPYDQCVCSTRHEGASSARWWYMWTISRSATWTRR